MQSVKCSATTLLPVPDVHGRIYSSNIVGNDRCRVVENNFFELATADELQHTRYHSFDGFGDVCLLQPLDLSTTLVDKSVRKRPKNATRIKRS